MGQAEYNNVSTSAKRELCCSLASTNHQPEYSINLHSNNYNLMLNGGTDSIERDMLYVITQPLHRQKLRTVNFVHGVYADVQASALLQRQMCSVQQRASQQQQQQQQLMPLASR